MMTWRAVIALAGVASAAGDAIVEGNIRVQALSPTLVRVEPKGPAGFEDGTTFMVTGRGFPGVPISLVRNTTDAATFGTKFYEVTVRKQKTTDSKATCKKPVTGQDYHQATRSIHYKDGLQVSDLQGCCDACEGDASCIGWVYDPKGKSCWPLSDFASPFPVSGDTDRQSGCSSRSCSLQFPTCSKIESGKDVDGARRSSKFSQGVKVSSRDECCEHCNNDPTCTAFVHVSTSVESQLNESSEDVPGANCWPLSGFSGTRASSGREVGYSTRPYAGLEFQVTSLDGKVLYNTTQDTWKKSGNLLHWPSPMSQVSYALTDYPRFFVPEWGTVPIPDGKKVEPELVKTNGYDFRNNVAGDTYVFLLGSDLKSYQDSRVEFLKLAGECPLLPDYAFGTWYTAWAQYTYDSATAEIKKWGDLNLPLSVWGLDMNWRETDHNKDRFYNHSASKLFPNFTQWFEFVKDHKLRTYFNDHPYPVQDRNAGGGQTSPEESKFRWEGLSKWLSQGLTYWWFDHNWGFSIPPPFVDNGGKTDGNWLGLDNAAWGSHVYYNAVSYFDKHAPASLDYGGRPMTLTKFGLPDWRPGMDPKGHAESPAQHRFPVWWTGDGVPLQGSVESMVDAGVHDFKPYVHSDCGGDYKPKAGDFMRWTAHCSYGSIIRYHDAGAGAHHPWDYDTHTLEVTRNYLNARSKLTPSLIAAGQKATKTGHPIVARCDLFWPEHSESATNQQYMYLDDILVAPIWDSSKNVTSRSVWLPPGSWQDAWDGSIVTGPKTMTVSQPFEKIPMWHKRDGGFVVVADEPALRVEDQDWSSLTLELFPAVDARITTRNVYERGSTQQTELTFKSDGQGSTQVEIQPTATGKDRAWTVRMHLRPGQHAHSASIDGNSVSLAHLEARSGQKYFPLGGAGNPPARDAGAVAELRVPAGSHHRMIELKIDDAVIV